MKKNSISVFFEKFSTKATKICGSSGAFITAILIVLAWVFTGPIFNYSDTWQLVINTGTTIITFLMVFLIQKTQNKDSLAIQVKLDELIAATETASNRIVDVEDMTEDELEVLHKYYARLASMAKQKKDFLTSHTIEEKIHDVEKRKKHVKK